MIKKLKKTISFILAFAIIFDFAPGIDTKVDTYAASGSVVVSYDESTNMITVSSSSPASVSLVGTGGSTYLEYYTSGTLLQQAGGSISINDSNIELIVEAGSDTNCNIATRGALVINGSNTGSIAVDNNSITINEGGEMDIPSGSTISLTNGTTVTNYGTISTNTFSAPDYGTLYNHGKIQATTISLSGTDFTSYDSAVYYPDRTFSKGNYNLSGLVVAGESTRIMSDGGSFSLSYGGVTRTISDVGVDNSASYLLNPHIEAENVPSDDVIYYGTDYDKALSKYVSHDDDFTGTTKIHYYSGSDSDGSEEIDKSDIFYGNTYNYRVTSEATTNCLAGSSDICSFFVAALPKDNISLSLSGLKNEVYAQDSVYLDVTSGYQVTKYTDNDLYADSLELTKDDLYPEGNGGNFYEGLYFTVKRKSDEATTDSFLWNEVPGINQVIFDEADPALSGSILADGEAVEVTSGEEIVADKVTFTIVDENLDSVKVNGTANTIDETDDGYKSDVSIDVPEGAAKQYTIVSEDKSGRSYTLSMKLKHTRKTATAEVSVPNTTEGEDYEPTVTTDSDGKDEATILYKARAVTDDSAFSSTKPTAPGTYVVRATIPQTDYYEEIVCENTFTINEKEEEPDTEEPTTEEPDPEEPNTENPPENLPKKDATITVKTHDQFYGVVYDYPSVETNSDGAITFMYKAKGAADSTLSLEKPTAIGTYIVRAYVAESDNYNANRADAEFAISYLDAPTDAYSLQGDKGNNDYYITDVRIVAPTGYEISSSLDGLFTGSISYSDTLRSIYLRRKSDGAKTSSISFSEKLKIDTVYPSVGYSVKDQDNNSVNLSGSYYADQVTFTISDDHLQTVLVNNEKVQISDNKATIIIDSANGIKSFSISAEDEAGNVFEAEVTIEATWRIKMLLPSGEIVPLVPGEAYKLGSGNWTTDQDPNTVYSGNQTVYVSGGGDFTFDPQ